MLHPEIAATDVYSSQWQQNKKKPPNLSHDKLSAIMNTTIGSTPSGFGLIISAKINRQ